MHTQALGCDHDDGLGISLRDPTIIMFTGVKCFLRIFFFYFSLKILILDTVTSILLVLTIYHVSECHAHGDDTISKASTLENYHMIGIKRFFFGSRFFSYACITCI